MTRQRLGFVGIDHASVAGAPAPVKIRLRHLTKRFRTKDGVGLGLILIAISKMHGAKSGLGYLIWNAWEVLDVEAMYVGLFVIALIGFLPTHFLNAMERIVVPWKR